MWLRITLLFVCFLLSFSKTIAQPYTYKPFPDSNFMWKGRVTCHYGSQGGSSEQSWTYYLNGDSLINGYLYHGLRRNSGVTVYCIREDSTKKVYILESGVDVLLFDFGLDLGDTTTCAGGTFVVSAVDTLSYNGVMRRRLVMSYPANPYFGDVWIEGIGSLAGGPVGYKWHWFCVALGSSLCLAQQDTFVLYGQDCPVQTGMENVEEWEVSVFPNPVANVLHVKTAQLPMHSTYFKLYSTDGKLLKDKKIDSKDVQLYRENIPTGIYFWLLVSDNQVLKTGKVLFN